MKIQPLIRSSASIASFMLAFSKEIPQLINVTSNTIMALNAETLEIENVYPFEQAILQAVPFIQNGRNFVIIEEKQLLVKLSCERGEIHTDLLETAPSYSICASSLDYLSAAFIGQQEICFLGEFSSSNDNYLFNAPRYAVYGEFGLVVLYSDSLHEVWVQCIKGDKLSPPQEVQEDIWHLLAFENLIIALGSGISMICDPWTGKLQSFVLQNANIMSVTPGTKDGEFYASDCLGSLLEVTTDGKQLASTCAFTASQANSLTFVKGRHLFLGSRSGDSMVVDLDSETTIKRYPSLAPIHDISEMDGKLYLASGMDKTGTFKAIKQIIKAGEVREIELGARVKQARTLFQSDSKLVFEIVFEDGLLEGSALYFYENASIEQLPTINSSTSDFTRHLVLNNNDELTLVFIDDKRVVFYSLKGEQLFEIHARELAEGESIIYCQAAPDNRALILTMTGNFVCVVAQDFKWEVHYIEIDEIPLPLLEAAISDDGVMALLFDQVPYVILYKDDFCLVEKFDSKGLLEEPPDISIFYLLEGGIPPNNTRPALIARLLDGKLLACPFSSDACEVMTGVMHMSFVGKRLIVGHRGGELGIYDIEGLCCADYAFHKFAGLKAVYCAKDSIFVLDSQGNEFLLQENVVEIFDGVIFAETAMSPASNELTAHLVPFANQEVYFAYRGTSLLLLQDTQQTYTVESRTAHALARSVCQFQKRYIAAVAVRAQELNTPRMPQAEKAILTRSGYLADLAADNLAVEQTAPSRRLISIIEVLDEHDIEIASLALENVHVTRIVSCKLNKYPQDFLAVSAIVPLPDEGESGFVAVYQLDNNSLHECGRFTTRRGVYHLVPSERRLLAGSADSLIVLDYFGTSFQYAPPEVHGTPDGLYEVGYASPCVFMTSMAASGDVVAFSDLAKGVFTAQLRGEQHGRVEVINMRRYPGKGVVGCIAKPVVWNNPRSRTVDAPESPESGMQAVMNAQLLICSPDGHLELYQDNKPTIEMSIGAQVLTLRESDGGWIYGCSNGEIGLITLKD